MDNYITFEVLLDFCTFLVALIALFVSIYYKKDNRPTLPKYRLSF